MKILSGIRAWVLNRNVVVIVFREFCLCCVAFVLGFQLGRAKDVLVDVVICFRGCLCQPE